MRRKEGWLASLGGDGMHSNKKLPARFLPASKYHYVVFMLFAIDYYKNYFREILTTLFPLKIIVPRRRLASSAVSSTSSRTMFIYSS